MTMIYYAGSLLDWVFADPRTVIRGYDEAGNQLARVAVSTRVATSFTDTVEVSGATETVTRTHTCPCFTSMGVASTGTYTQTFTRTTGSADVPANALQPFDFAPRAIAARSDGWMFTASGPIVHDYSPTGTPIRTLLDGAGNYGYVDFSRVFRADGDQVDFPPLHGAAIRDIALDSQDRIIVCGQESAIDRAFLRQYDADGNLLWSKTGGEITSHYYYAYHCHVDSSDSIYVCLYQSASPIQENGYLSPAGTRYSCLAKYNSAGALQWAWMFNDQLRAISSDGAGSLYIPGGWQFRYPPVEDADLDADEFIYYDPVDHSRPLIAKLSAATGVPTVFLAPLAGDEYPASPGSYPAVAYGGGYVHYSTWTAGRYADDTIWDYRKLDPSDLSVINQEYWWASGSFQVSAAGVAQFGTRRLSSVRDCFHFKQRSTDCARAWGDETEGNPWAFLSATNAPGVDIIDGTLRVDAGYFDVDYITPYGQPAGPDYSHSSLGEPWSCRDIWISETTQTSPISLRLHLGTVDTIGDTYTVAPGCRLACALGSPVSRREYMGALRLPDVYRASLGGSLWLSVSSLSIRRSIAGDQLSVVVPSATPETIAAVLALDGETLTLWRGVRMVGGLEQLEPMLSVPLSSTRYDRGSQSGSISLGGEAVSAPVVSRQRALAGVSYRAISGGARRVRCAVDTYLAPGDVAIIGTEALTVSTITITVSPSAALMEVSESV